ncbi:hypothetical protein K461DRAFT_270154 [Myriangium duriaei CBS 260.36]|uniref:Ubiquitin-like domain-containing protein n=1 Tax=Myriangium duriaei CBS 260.36 TaxID=1168546 RepID=A0A9P4J1L5_9PEZI|nr:hypothetical protein K461DRAFT_270154 [Myriangium duriaei CBS 260.36]
MTEIAPQADVPRPPPGDQRIHLRILTPASGLASEVVEIRDVPLNITIETLKQRITYTSPSHPPVPTQRLIFSGRVLADNNARLVEALGADAIRNNDTLTIHMVVRGAQSQPVSRAGTPAQAQPAGVRMGSVPPVAPHAQGQQEHRGVPGPHNPFAAIPQMPLGFPGMPFPQFPFQQQQMHPGTPQVPHLPHTPQRAQTPQTTQHTGGEPTAHPLPEPPQHIQQHANTLQQHAAMHQAALRQAAGGQMQPARVVINAQFRAVPGAPGQNAQLGGQAMPSGFPAPPGAGAGAEPGLTAEQDQELDRWIQQRTAQIQQGLGMPSDQRSQGPHTQRQQQTPTSANAGDSRIPQPQRGTSMNNPFPAGFPPQNPFQMAYNPLFPFPFQQVPHFGLPSNHLANSLANIRAQEQILAVPGTMYLLSSPTGPQAIIYQNDGMYQAQFPGLTPTPTQPLPSASNTNASAGPEVPQNRDNQQAHRGAAPPPPAPGARPNAAAAQQQVANLVNGPNAVAAEPPGLFAPILNHFWLLFRILLFAYFFLGGDDGWRRPLLLAGIAGVFFLVRGFDAGRGFRDALRTWWDGIVGLPPRRQGEQRPEQPEHGQQQAQRPAGEQRAPVQNQAAPQPAPQPQPARAEEDNNMSPLRRRLRPVERGAALFVASLWPGVGENTIRQRREADELVARQEAEAAAAAAAALAPAREQGQQVEDGNVPAVQDQDQQVEDGSVSAAHVDNTRNHSDLDSMRAQTSGAASTHGETQGEATVRERRTFAAGSHEGEGDSRDAGVN